MAVPKTLKVLLVFNLSFILLRAVQPHPYKPQDVKTIDCGSSGNNTALDDGRSWIGDINSTYQHASLTIRTHLHDTATNTRSKVRKVALLCFYTYQYVDLANTFLPVKAGQYTLLNKFTILHTMREERSMKEFTPGITG
ncbi:hypothetical protein TIFTF001_036965 [Ficus carica]|uniref:Uncharacterized protein n=1 Tax=Ficus carica TaxID=3494 RepID=A0AA88JBE0_FICCA|nr:hypothetical protein TIFTF001_036938 [Ficus carica]GMN67891.1 hypothetical protein TIFTF001_036946 [Ficus carica]GMN67892.1 hypothetical protein TIFTF001_036957 [Ficus carica]GMN67909.1 hypothetical protein TIFTF001_036965 [Ficus carica]